MKMKRSKYLSEERKIVESEEEYIDRGYYIPKILEKIKQGEKTVVVEVYGGCVTEVHNLPKDHKYELVDWDALNEGMSEEEFKELLEKYDLVEE